MEFFLKNQGIICTTKINPESKKNVIMMCFSVWTKVLDNHSESCCAKERKKTQTALSHSRENAPWLQKQFTVHVCVFFSSHPLAHIPAASGSKPKHKYASFHSFNLLQRLSDINYLVRFTDGQIIKLMNRK